MPTGLGTRNTRTMIARLQAYGPLNTVIYGKEDIKVT